MASGTLTDSLRETLALFDRSGTPWTTTEVADLLDLGRRSAYDRLDRLVDHGELETKKVGAAARVWWRPTSPDDPPAAADRSSASGPLVDVLDGAEVGVLVLDEDLDAAWINEATERYFGLDRERAIGRDKRRLIDEHIAPAVEDSASFAETVLATYDDNTYTERFECRVTAGEGRRARWLEHRSKPIETGRYAGGRVELYYDVTDRRRSERTLNETEQRFRSLVEAVEEYAIFMLDPDGRVQTWNEGAERIKGYTADEVVGEHISTFYTDDDREAGIPGENLANAAAEGSIEEEGWRVRADGSRFWGHVTITAIHDDDGELDGFAKVTRDMTTRREHERQLRRERDLVERILDVAPVNIGVVTPDGTVTRANRYVEDSLEDGGTSAEEYTVGDWDLYADGEYVPVDDRPYMRVFETGEPVFDWECRIERPSGDRHWLSISAVPLRGDDGIERVVVCAEDVTQLEEQARRLERQRDDLEVELGEVFERISAGFYGLDENLQFTYVNDRAEALLGLDEPSVIGQHIREGLPLTDRFEAGLREALEDREPVFLEDYYEPLDAWFENALYPSETGVSVYFRDVTDRKARERQLEEYEHIVETVDDGIYLVDEDLRIRLVNEAYASITGYSREELLGAHISTVVDEAVVDFTRERRERMRAGEAGGTAEVDLETATGETVTVEARYAPLADENDGFRGTVGVIRDVTARKEREQELERYETIVETVDDGVYALDADGRIAMVNDTFCELTGYDRGELLGAHPTLINSASVNEAADRVSERIDEGEIEGGVLEFEIERADGTSVPVESRFTHYEYGEGVNARCGVVRDITERLGRERELEESERRYRALAEDFPNGIVALFDDGLRYTLADGRPFEEYSIEPDDLDGAEVGEQFASPDVRERFRTHCRAALDGETREFEFTFDDHVFDAWVVPVTDETGAVFAGMIMTQDVTDRVERERELERQRERLTALDELNGVFRDITEAVIEQSTREEIEGIVCDRLAASDSYRFAWIGDVDTRTRTVNLRTEAGVEGYLDGITISVDPDDRRSEGPTGRAILTKDIQVVQDVLEDSQHDPWRDHVRRYGFRSSAAIPIVHEGTVYGVLNVYAERPGAFSRDERSVIGQLGEIIGHAIASVDRKQALLSDEVVELGFRITDVFDAVDVPASIDGTITLDRTVPAGDGVYLEYGTATGDAMEAVEALVAAEAVPHWESVSVIGTEGDVTRFELRLVDPPVISAVATHGGYVRETRIGDGDWYMRIYLAPTVDVGRVVDVIRAAHPQAEVVTRRQLTRRGRTDHGNGRTLTDDLTDRQRAALEAAFYSGYFDWPRAKSGEDVAESLDVSSPTFHQHLRKAQRTLVAAVLDDRPSGAING